MQSNILPFIFPKKHRGFSPNTPQTERIKQINSQMAKMASQENISSRQQIAQKINSFSQRKETEPFQNENDDQFDFYIKKYFQPKSDLKQKQSENKMLQKKYKYYSQRSNKLSFLNESSQQNVEIFNQQNEKLIISLDIDQLDHINPCDKIFQIQIFIINEELTKLHMQTSEVLWLNQLPQSNLQKSIHINKRFNIEIRKDQLQIKNFFIVFQILVHRIHDNIQNSQFSQEVGKYQIQTIGWSLHQVKKQDLVNIDQGKFLLPIYLPQLINLEKFLQGKITLATCKQTQMILHIYVRKNNFPRQNLPEQQIKVQNLHLLRFQGIENIDSSLYINQQDLQNDSYFAEKNEISNDINSNNQKPEVNNSNKMQILPSLNRQFFDQYLIHDNTNSNNNNQSINLNNNNNMKILKNQFLQNLNTLLKKQIKPVNINNFELNINFPQTEKNQNSNNNSPQNVQKQGFLKFIKPKSEIIHKNVLKNYKSIFINQQDNIVKNKNFEFGVQFEEYKQMIRNYADKNKSSSSSKISNLSSKLIKKSINFQENNSQKTISSKKNQVNQSPNKIASNQLIQQKQIPTINTEFQTLKVKNIQIEDMNQSKEQIQNNSQNKNESTINYSSQNINYASYEASHKASIQSPQKSILEELSKSKTAKLLEIHIQNIQRFIPRKGIQIQIDIQKNNQQLLDSLGQPLTFTIYKYQETLSEIIFDQKVYFDFDVSIFQSLQKEQLNQIRIFFTLYKSDKENENLSMIGWAMARVFDEYGKLQFVEDKQYMLNLYKPPKPQYILQLQQFTKNQTIPAILQFSAKQIELNEQQQNNLLNNLIKIQPNYEILLQ